MGSCNCWKKKLEEMDAFNSNQELQISNSNNNKGKINKNIINFFNGNDDLINHIDTNNSSGPLNISDSSTISKLLKTLAKTRKLLKITILESKYLQEGKEILINAAGLLGSQRNAFDGKAIFGDVNNNNTSNTDFIFPREESNTGQNHCEIRYDFNQDIYQIKSLRENGCFLRIDKKIVSQKIFIFLFIKKKFIVTQKF